MKAIEIQCCSKSLFVRHQYCLKEYTDCVISTLIQPLKTYMNDRTLLIKANKLIKNQLKVTMIEDYFYFKLPGTFTPQQWPSLSYIYCQ